MGWGELWIVRLDRRRVLLVSRDGQLVATLLPRQRRQLTAAEMPKLAVA